MLLIVFSLLIAISAVVFALQNPDMVTITFLSTRFQGSLAFILMITFACGFISCALMALAALVQRKLTEPFKKKKLSPAKPLPGLKEDERT